MSLTERPPVKKAREYSRIASRKAFWAGLLTALFLTIVGLETFSRVADHRALGKETEILATMTVAVIHPKREPAQEELVLPPTLQAYTESPIYARTDGYLSKRYHDIDNRVRKGDLIAEIETPEIDQELMQAGAAVEQATAQLDIAKTAAQRWELCERWTLWRSRKPMNAQAGTPQSRPM